MGRWRSACGILASAIGIVSCSGLGTDASNEPTDIDIEPIVGGTLASDYPEAVYVNIDIVNGRGYACSAALIAPRVVLTAGHCVDGHSRFEVYAGSSYRVSTSSATYDWAGESTTYVNPSHHDIGLIFLDTAVTLTSYPQLATSKIADGTTITNVGRVLDGSVRSSLYQASTVAYSAASIGYPYDYTSTDLIQPGDSGGPVFVAGTHKIVAVNSGAGSGIQVLARVDLLATWIGAQIAAHGGTGLADSGCAAAAGCSDARPDGNADGAASTPAADAGAQPSPTDAGANSPSPDSGPASPDSGPASPDSGAKSPADAGSNAPNTDAGTPSPAADSGASPKSDAGATPSADSGAGAGDAGQTCATEHEPNNTFATAEPLGHELCGSISPATDGDWLYFDAKAGVHVIRITSSADATMMMGIVSGKTCVSTVEGLRSAKVKVFRGSQRLCVRIDSSHRRTQTYRLTVD